MLLECILLGCSDRYMGNDNIDTIKGEKIKMVRLADLSRGGMDNINGFIKCGDKLVVGTTFSAEGIARTLDLNNPEQENLSAKGRFSSGRLRSLSSFCSFDGFSVTALDFEKGELIECAVSPLARGESQEFVIHLPKGQQHLIAVKAKDFVVSTGFYEEGRYLLYSLVDGSARYFLSYPNHPDYPDLQEKTKAMLYASSILRVRPDQSAFVCADMYSGVIDFCRITADSIERVKMIRLHYPKVEIMETPSPRVAYYRDNRFGFSDIAVTEGKVYALYSGKSYQEAGGQVSGGQTLLVYDWEGNLVKSCSLEEPLTNMSYDWSEKEIYGITSNGKLIKICLE